MWGLPRGGWEILDGPHCGLRVRSHIRFSRFVVKVILCLWAQKAGTAGLTNAVATALSVAGTEAPVYPDEHWENLEC